MRIFLDSIGCRLNQGEIEKMAAQFRTAGHELVSSDADADLVVINTCAVTSEAASDSRGKIRHAARAGAQKVVVTGCWASIDPDGAGQLPGVYRVVSNQGKEHLVSDLFDLPPDFDLEPLAREPLPGIHQRTRAFIKVQDGCDNHCTYCITRIARGVARSVPVDIVLHDIMSAQRGGVKEIVLTGVHLGSWGQEMNPVRHLRHLVDMVLQETDVDRVRLSSLEPWDLTEEFFEIWENPRMCRHLHLPLQSGCAATLRRMGRKVTPESFANLVKLARKAAPEMAITTDMITGFPGETDDEFLESMEYVRGLSLAGGHVFTYSPRPGTPAASYPGQISPKVAKTRSAKLRTLFADSAKEYQSRHIEQVVQVLWEAADQVSQGGWRMSGLTDNYLRVQAATPDYAWNRIDWVKIISLGENGLLGELV